MNPVLPLVLLVVGGVLVLASGQAELRRRWCSWVGAAAVLFTASHLPHGMLVLALALAAVGGAELARLLVPAGPARRCCWAAAPAGLAVGTLLPAPVLLGAVFAAALLHRPVAASARPAARPALAVVGLGLPLAVLATLPTAWTVPALMAVSVGDVAAWAGGRTLGRRGMLARGLSRWSPNKTWAGALASVLAGGAVLGCFGQWWLVPFVPIAGIVGDLRESQVKRRAGVKDAGAWLPGFGGLLDRIDSVLGALVGIAVAGVAAAHPLLCAVVLLAVLPPAVLRRTFWRIAFMGTGGLVVRGTLPRGACVVVAPHISHADTAAAVAALDAGHAPTVAAAADYWFATALRAALCRALVGGFAVRRTGGGMADLLGAGAALTEGRAVVVYPEGTRDATDGAWRGGAFRLASEFGVPVVPLSIEGTGQLLPKSGRLSRARISVTVGAPIPSVDPVIAAELAREWVARRVDRRHEHLPHRRGGRNRLASRHPARAPR